MALLPTGWIKMPGDNDETKRFAWSHVKSIFYNKAANILLKDKLDEMDKIIDEKIAKALMSNVQVNDQSKIPTSALAYAMQQSITKNGQDIAKLNNNKLDITGGTIQTSESVPLVLKNSANDYSYLDFHGKSGRLGMLGMDKMNTPVFYDTNWEIHELALKSDLVAGTAKFPKTSVGTQEIIIDFPYEMETVPVVLVSWKDTTHIFEHMDGLVVTGIEKTRFKVASRRKIESYDWGFSYLAICR